MFRTLLLIAASIATTGIAATGVVGTPTANAQIVTYLTEYACENSMAHEGYQVECEYIKNLEHLPWYGGWVRK
ncbi:hypothetical protein [Nocardia brasiliensis]|uniref:hypothetical protein n=1 Tax=Nocardia brasiliensis TaxID=37326 RepID=UPI0036707BF9